MTFLLITALGLGALQAAEISLESRIEPASESLTTQAIWKIEPKELNPHRRTWALERSVQLMELKGVPAPGKSSDFMLEAPGLRALTRIHQRASGPWYFPIARFSCQPQADDWFSTREGSRLAAQTAAEHWQATLSERRTRLSAALSRVRASSPDVAVARGYQVFQDWLKAAESEWRAQAETRARIAEWRSYLKLAKDLPACTDRLKKTAKASRPPKRESLMEPLPEWNPESRMKLLARVPAKRWNGLYSVRVSVDVGSKSLTGVFLVDSGASMSVMSPQWMEGQGVSPELIELRGVPPRKIHWAGGTSFARVGQVFEARVGGLKLPIREFLLLDTELFIPPDSPGACCDGILGADFLREFAVEFRAEEPYSLEIWPRAGFHWGPDRVWLEASTLPTGEVISEECLLLRGASTRIRGVRWDTGSDSAVDLHRPYASIAAGSKDGWSVNCSPDDEFYLAKKIQVTLPLRSEKAGSGPFALSFPGFNVGMDLLGRSNFVFDLSNGRIWFHPKGLESEVPTNRTGLKLAYRLNRFDERELYVAAIAPGSKASVLAKKGLKAGLVISEIDSRPAEELDLWRIEQRLAGVFGGQVILQWETPQGRKLVPLEVR
jgi:hypothetical protein